MTPSGSLVPKTPSPPGRSSSSSTLDGVSGVGESFPVPYYGETPATVMAVLPTLLGALDALGPLPGDRQEATDWLERSAALMGDALGHHGGAKAGLDIALHDIAGKALGLPLWELLGTSDQLPPTDYSLGLDEPDQVAERARRVAGFPALKVKVGGPADIETLEAVREVYGGPLRVDANTGWQPGQAAALLPVLERLGVELIEQPFPARRLAQLRWLREQSSLPILADEIGRLRRGPRAPRGRRGRSGREAREVWRRGPRAADDQARSGTGAQGHARLHGRVEPRHRCRSGHRLGGRLGRPRRQPAPAQTTRSRVSSWTRTAAGGCLPGRGWASTGASRPDRPASPGLTGRRRSGASAEP